MLAWQQTGINKTREVKVYGVAAFITQLTLTTNTSLASALSQPMLRTLLCAPVGTAECKAS